MRITTTTLLMLGASLLSAPALAYDGSCRSLEDVEELPPRHWCEVPNSRLVSAEKKPSEFDDWNGSRSAAYDSFQRTSGVDAVTDAWGGGAFDTKRNCLMVFGGGHNDYGGNEIYAFCIGDLAWRRLSDPTPFPRRNPSYQNDDGTPVSRHTYGGLAYIAAADRFFAFDGAPDDGPGTCGVRGTWTFDLAAREAAGKYSPSQWELRTTSNEPEHRCDNAAAYDPRTGKVIFKSRATHLYDFETNRWSQASSRERLNSGVTLAVDPKNRMLVEVGGGVTALWSIDQSFSGGQVSTSGPKDVQNADDPGLAYDTRLEKIVGWRGGTTVYTFDVPSRTWTAVPAADTNRANPGSVTTQGGVFGRFAYSPELNVYIYVDQVDDNVMLYRLTDAEAAAPPNPPTDLNVE